MKNRAYIGLLAAAAALTLTACEMRVIQQLTINPDSTGSYTQIVQLDETLAALMEIDPDTTAEDLFTEEDTGTLEDFTMFINFKPDGAFEMGGTTEFDTLETLTAKYPQTGEGGISISDDFGMGELGDSIIYYLTDDNGIITFDYTLPASLADVETELMSGAGDDDLGMGLGDAFAAEMVEDILSGEIVVTLTGELVEHNADHIISDQDNKHTFTWEYDFSSQQVGRRLHATVDNSEPTIPLPLILGSVLAVAILTGAGIFIGKKKRGNKQPGNDTNTRLQ